MKKLGMGEVLKGIMAIRGMTQTHVANELGITREALWARLNSRRMPIDTILKVCDIAGYEVLIVPKNGQGKGLPRFTIGGDKV